jgi:amino acid adenylation domain-containing protein
VLIHEAIAAHAARVPGQTAVVAGDRMLTYAELSARAHALATQLRELGLAADDTVASYLPRETAMAVAVLGVWEAGGAYVPIDPSASPERAAYMVRDCGATTAIRAAGDGRRLPDRIKYSIELDTADVLPRHHSAIGKRDVLSSDLAYVIYTSGSTGRPKGVMVEHGHMSAMAEAHEATLYSGAGRTIGNVAWNNISTADSFFSDFVHLAYGRTLYVVDDDTRRNPDRLAQFITDHRIDVLDATPTQIRSVLLAGHDDVLDSLTLLILGGEPITPELWKRLQGLPHVAAYNLYGPTECTVAVTSAALKDHGTPVIGTPMPGNNVLIVDRHGCPVPDGEIGELCITGSQVARGYISKNSSHRNPFIRLPSMGNYVRAYLTGDRGRYNRAGQIEFLGRSDDQVSINGHRVELGEIDARLRACKGVLNCAVGLLTDRMPSTLTAWVVLDRNIGLDAVREAFSATLPPHMRPRLIPVPVIPMGPTGKADTATLPRAKMSQARTDTDEDHVSAVVRRVWLDVLHLCHIGDEDDFFVLGGDSFAATQIIVAIRNELTEAIPMRTIFEQPQFAGFCRSIQKLMDCEVSGEH